jgi:hypothetical protein
LRWKPPPPPRCPGNHFAWTKGETEIQLTTIGPWKLVYVNPADDPSKKKQLSALS